MKWVNKLSKAELLELHKSVVCADTNGIDDLYVDRDGNYIDIDFNENWPYDDGTPSYIPTRYLYYDFNYEDCDTIGELNNGAYRTWMAKRFGKDYLLDLLKTKLGINVEDIDECKEHDNTVYTKGYKAGWNDCIQADALGWMTDYIK